MTFAKNIIQVCEDFEGKQYDKLLPLLKEHTFKANDRNIKESSLLLNDDSAKFEDANVSNRYADDDDALSDQLETSIEPYFKITNLKDLVMFVYDEYGGEKILPDVNPDELALFFARKLKNQDIDFVADIEVNFFDDKTDRVDSSSDYKVKGVMNVAGADYDKAKDVLEIYGDVKSIISLEQS